MFRRTPAEFHEGMRRCYVKKKKKEKKPFGTFLTEIVEGCFISLGTVELKE